MRIEVLINKVLQCEGIMEEYEDDIIQHYTGEDETDSYIQICTNVSKLCQGKKYSPSVDVNDHSFSDEL